MKLYIAICDDEKIICNKTRQFLLSIRPDYNIDIFLSGKELLETEQNYDIIFLDIGMPDPNGMRTAELLRQKQNPAFLIFLTNYEEYMPEAFKVRAFRFLTKPIDSHELEESLLEAEKEILSNKKISIYSHGTIHLVAVTDIICFEAYGDGTYIYTTSKSVLDSPKTLKYWIQTMGTRHFFQTHKSYFVSMRHIKTIQGNILHMHYINQPIPVSRRYHADFREKLNTYIKENSKYV